MKRINLKLIALVLLTALPTLALGHDHRYRDHDGDRYRGGNDHRITSGHISGFRIIIDATDVTGIRYSQDARRLGAVIIDPNHYNRFTAHPHRWHSHDGMPKLSGEWPNRNKKWSGHGRSRLSHQDHGRKQGRHIGWSRFGNRHH